MRMKNFTKHNMKKKITNKIPRNIPISKHNISIIVYLANKIKTTSKIFYKIKIKSKITQYNFNNRNIFNNKTLICNNINKLCKTKLINKFYNSNISNSNNYKLKKPFNNKTI